MTNSAAIIGKLKLRNNSYIYNDGSSYELDVFSELLSGVAIAIDTDNKLTILLRY